MLELLFNKRDVAFSERASVLLSSLQRDAAAMAALRARLESKLRREESSPSPTGCEQMSILLEFLRAGEGALNELAGASEPSRYMNEFLGIIASAAASISSVRTDMEKAIPSAEKALEEIMSVITSCNLSPESERERQQVMAEAADASTAQVPAKPSNTAECLQEEPGELAA